MAIQRVEVFYKQKQFYFYPAWAYLCYSSLIKIPLSLGESLVWTSLTHYVIGFTPQPISLLLTPLANRRWMDFKELKITISEILISLELSQECCGSWRRDELITW
ncbi:ABC transporter G family member 33-like isoform X2 [Cucumis sativus]|uniref:ABC transporter G family member 33-like isoform X2 n=1 Tax=Cucumis sativus TaxID=3659 RepID=UPI0012F4A737|nr:ABC transporter G family member 33-like isoform X2 [Cucumis sativus]